MSSGNKYHRTVTDLRPQAFRNNTVEIDVYRVLKAFNITDPGCQHAAKKILCRGIRGKGDELQDTIEAIDALIESAVMLVESTEMIKPMSEWSHNMARLDALLVANARLRPPAKQESEVQDVQRNASDRPEQNV